MCVCVQGAQADSCLEVEAMSVHGISEDDVSNVVERIRDHFAKLALQLRNLERAKTTLQLATRSGPAHLRLEFVVFKDEHFEIMYDDEFLRRAVCDHCRCHV